MFISEGWSEAVSDLDLGVFVLEVLKELYAVNAASILSRNFLKSLLISPSEVRPTQVPGARAAVDLVRSHWTEVDPEMLLLVVKSDTEPLHLDE
jgi:hypothetical protein